MQLYILLLKLIINILIVVGKMLHPCWAKEVLCILMIYIFFSIFCNFSAPKKKGKRLIKLVQFMSSVWEKNELFKYLNCNGMLKFLFTFKREEVKSCYLAKLFFYKHFSQNAALLWNKNKSFTKMHLRCSLAGNCIIEFSLI